LNGKPTAVGGSPVEQKMELDSGNEATESIDLRLEALLALAYFALYLGYMFIRPENEWLHWLSLVLIPFALLSLWHGRVLRVPFRDNLATFGLRRGNLTSGLLWAVVLGLAISALQLFMSRQADAFLELIRSGRALLLFPLALLLLLLTAGFTEEFFFRGVLLTRLIALFGSKVWAIVVSSLLFGLYHLPYAYLNPNWPSHGNWVDALTAALVQGIPAGLILGILYVRTQNNLISCVVLHSFINVLPAMTLIKFSGS
jgi:membrane protease YdiL (CAAX protease family)